MSAALSTIIAVAIMLALACLALWIEQRWQWAKTVSAVVFCYALGFAFNQGSALLTTNQQPWITESMIRNIAGGCLLLALPLLIFQLDIKAWLKLAGRTAFGFGLATLAVLIAVLIGFAIFSDIPQRAEVAGMLSALYTGSAANMSAVGIGLGMNTELIAVVASADILIGAVYLIIMVTVAPDWMAKIFPIDASTGAKTDNNADICGSALPKWLDLSLSLLLAAACAITAIGGSLLIYGELNDFWLIMSVTGIATALSMIPAVRRLHCANPAGLFFMLIFSVALGCTLELLKISSLMIASYVMGAMVLAVALHLVLGKVFKLDRDTIMVTSCASIMGPPFIPLLIRRLDRPELLFSGISCAIFGAAFSNYLGLGLGRALLGSL